MKFILEKKFGLMIVVLFLICLGIYHQIIHLEKRWNISPSGGMSTITSTGLRLHDQLRETNVRTLNNHRHKYMIYLCRGKCGGFADRLRGIVNVFLMAKKSARLFRMIEERPCGTTVFLSPSAVDWTVKPGELKGLSNKTYNEIYPHNLTKYLTHDSVYVRSRTKMPINNTNSYVFQEVFNSLFVLRSDVKKEIDKFRSNIVKNRKLICAHIRIGKNEQMKDSLYNNLGNISAIWRFFSKYDKDGHVLFIATDSVDILKVAKAQFSRRMVDIKGKILHVDKMKDDTMCSGMRKVLVDFYILSMCDILLLTKSNIGRFASYLRNSKKGQFCFDDEEVYACPSFNIVGHRTVKTVRRLTNN